MSELDKLEKERRALQLKIRKFTKGKPIGATLRPLVVTVSGTN